MSPAPPPADHGDIDDADLGAPVEQLQALSLTPHPHFERRVLGRLERRLLAGELLGLLWSSPLQVLLELIRAPFELFGGRADDNSG